MPSTGRLGLRGVGRDMVCFAETGGRYGDGTSSTELSGDVGKSRGEETKKNGDGAGFIARPGSKEKPRSGLPMPARSRRWPRARLEAVGSSLTVRCRPLSLFTLLTELPLDPFFKLLSILYGNSKISKNKSCSKLKVLQLCFNNHTQIMSTI